MAAPTTTARAIVRSIVSGSPACAPQATFTALTRGMSSSSRPMRQGPKLSPASQFSSMRTSRLRVPEGLCHGRLVEAVEVADELVVAGLPAFGDRVEPPHPERQCVLEGRSRVLGEGRHAGIVDVRLEGLQRRIGGAGGGRIFAHEDDLTGVRFGAGVMLDVGDVLRLGRWLVEAVTHLEIAGRTTQVDRSE